MSSSHHNAMHSLQDDEALARSLQYQEQTSSNHGRQNRNPTAQELHDLELARNFARMDYEGSSSTPMNHFESHIDQAPSHAEATSHAAYKIADEYSPSHLYPNVEPGAKPPPVYSVKPPSLSLKPPPSSSDIGTRTRESSTLQLDQRPESAVARRSISLETPTLLVDDFVEFDDRKQPAQPSHRKSVSVDDETLAFARRLQEQAFNKFSLNPEPPVDQLAVDADLALATKMQELEDQGMGRMNSQRRGLDARQVVTQETHPGTIIRPQADIEDGDAKLARFLASSGASMRQLDPDVVDDLLRSQDTIAGTTSLSSAPSLSLSNATGGAERVSLSAHINQHTVTATGSSNSTSFSAHASQYTAGTNSSYEESLLHRDPTSRSVSQPVGNASVPNQTSLSSFDISSAVNRSSNINDSPAPTLSSPPSPKESRYEVPNARSAPTTPNRQRGSGAYLPAPTTNTPDDTFLDIPATKEKKKKKFGFLNFGSRSGGSSGDREDRPERKSPAGAQGARTLGIADSIVPPPGGRSGPRIMGAPDSIAPTSFTGAAPPSDSAIMAGIPSSIPPPPGGSISATRTRILRGIDNPGSNGPSGNGQRAGSFSCSVCGMAGGRFVAALDKKFHLDCFRCVSCNELIDPHSQFRYSEGSNGEKHPHHRNCYTMFDIKCTVCKLSIPKKNDGTIAYVKHPFFEKEQMCVQHAKDRRCTGCQRFERKGEPFLDLNDGNRCVCFACCRSVVVDNNDVKPLWDKVLRFFENYLKIPLWPGMREIPILVVGSDALNDQLKGSSNPHGGSQQIMTAGLCLTDHDHGGGRRFKLPSMRFVESTSSFAALDDQDRGFTYYEVPEASNGNLTANVFAILCLSGLPRDLTASVLAHEATHAWIKLHPDHNYRKPIPAQVEEGCAQLIAMLFLSDGLDAAEATTDDTGGPSDEKLRQFFKFSIERDDNEIYGTGYRRAAMAYRDIGIEALMSHVVRYRDFPHT